MAEPFRIEDRGDHRVLWVGESPSAPTHYSERVIRMLIERKGLNRAPLYFSFKGERAPRFLLPLFRYLRTRGVRGLRALEVGCSFGHMTEYLAEQPEIATLSTFDTDAAFVEIARTKAKELGLTVIREVQLLDQGETCNLPWGDGVFDLVLAVGVVEHLPKRHRRAQVDEYWRVLAPGGHIAFLDTPNRWFPLETHSVGLPLVQWLPPRLAYRYAKLLRPARYGAVTFDGFTADGTGWRNATLGECLPSGGQGGVVDVTGEAGYGFEFFRQNLRSRKARALLPWFSRLMAVCATAGLPAPPLPYLNLLFRRER
jgi:2-polyprenyl-3-methyl-5-hydroxy-6-metoxy-1,4-benzoquinol methylase